MNRAVTEPGALHFLRRILTVRATINEVEGLLVAGEGKTDSSVRTISAPQWVLDMLAEHLARTGRTSPDDLVLQAPQGGPVRATNFRLRAYNPALRATDLEGLTFHRLRHSAGRMMRELGVPLESSNTASATPPSARQRTSTGPCRVRRPSRCGPI